MRVQRRRFSARHESFRWLLFNNGLSARTTYWSCWKETEAPEASLCGKRSSKEQVASAKREPQKMLEISLRSYGVHYVTAGPARS
jgi:hypothetical protein